LTISKAIEIGKERVGRKESEILLANSISKNRLYLITNPDLEISEELFLKHLSRRESGEPIEYITNRVSFYSKEFYIEKGALIPRPETEILIDKVLEVAKSFSNPKILEIGVGSGIISLVLGELLPNSTILGVDISLEALKVANRNLEESQLQNVKFIQSDLFSKVPNLDFQIIVSNPPYISDREKGKLQKELDFEPENALFGGEIGDEVLKKIVDTFLNSKVPYLFCEMGYDQKEKIEKFLNGRAEIEFYKDLANLDRGFKISKIGSF
jgi:release factor glutamine methyltransferase